MRGFGFICLYIFPARRAEINFYNQGQGLIGIIIVLIVVGVISGSLYFYLSKQIPEVPEISGEPVNKEVVKPEEEVSPSPKEEKPISAPEKKVTSMPEITCQNECSSGGSKRCSNSGYQTCGNYDTDSCLEWSSITNCPQNTLCQNGNCIQQKCSDGTPYGQCSTNKPKYCESGNLVDKASYCGCLSDYEVSDNICSKKLNTEKCGVIYEGTNDRTKSLNFVIVPADVLCGVSLGDPNAQYSNDLNAFATDAKQIVDGFLSVDPINKYKSVFNFYYNKSEVVECSCPGDYITCDLWKKPADDCDIPYDQVIILQRKPRGGLWGGQWVQSGLSLISEYPALTLNEFFLGSCLPFPAREGIFLIEDQLPASFLPPPSFFPPEECFLESPWPNPGCPIAVFP